MKIFRWWIIVTFVIFVLSGVGPQPAGSAALWQSKVDPALLSMAPGEPVEFIILLNQQASLHEAGLLKGKLEKTTFVAETLQETAARTQQPILARLASAGIEHRPYWIANMIWVRGDRSIIQSMAQRADVAHISANPQVRSDLPAPVSGASAPDAPGTALNIARVGAPQAWAAGFTGQGVVVAGQDTGYDWDHPALISQYRGWDGANADHNYNWHDAIHTSNGTCGADSQEPCDDQGHGTHTMGTIVGDDHQGNQIGMAPGARWIGCRNMNHGVGTPTTYAECFQWFMAPTDLEGNNPDPALAPDVINNSWGCPPSEGCDAANIQMLQGVVEAVRAAGILVVASAGNFGPACSTVKDPPGIYDASFSVGAVDNSDVAAGFSSRGGVGPDGSPLLKPDIAAPGVDVISSYTGGAYVPLSGTSMAAPHVAGLAALLISAEPAYHGQVDEIEAQIERTAVWLTASDGCGVDGSQIPNNVYGWGRIDAEKATDGLSLSKSATPAEIVVGEPITYTLNLNQIITATTRVVLTDTLPVGTTFITATLPYTMEGNTVRWDFERLEAGQGISVSLVVRAEMIGKIENGVYGVRSDQISTISRPPVVTSVIPVLINLYIPVVSKTP